MLLPRLLPSCAALALSCLALPLVSAPAAASQPAMWHFADENDFRRGNIDGLALHPTLGLSPAPKLARTEIDAEFVHTWLRDGSRLWLGTGLRGRLFLVEGGKVREVAKTEAAIVGALVADGKGGVYAGLVGTGEILQVTPDGKVTPVVTLGQPAAEGEDKGKLHVWALVLQGNTLFAGTGPGGKVWAVDLAKKTAKVWAETGADHVLTLLADAEGLIAGTSDAALLLRIPGEQQVRALASFPGVEVRDVIRVGKALYAVVNGGQTAAPLASLKPTAERPGGGTGTKPPAATKTGKDAAAKGKGAVWKRTDDGVVARVFISPEGMLSQLGAVGKSVVAGSARGGRVVIGDDFGDVQTLFDLAEEEVLGVEMGASGPATLFTGKSAAVYTVGSGDGGAVFTTDVLEETGVATWGRVEAIGEGSLGVETRSGFTDTANETWSPWQGLKGGASQSPPATHLQVRVRLASPQSRLTELKIHRQVMNRTPLVTKIDTVHNKAKGTWTISWGTEDSDNDALAFVVQYRMRGTKQWLMLHDRLYDKKTIEISPTDMPDGWYEMRVEVTDQPANSPRSAKATARISKPFLVDRGRPDVTASVKGQVLAGVASDPVSRIVKVEVSVDGQPSQLAAARDGIFDGPSEAFEIDLPALTGPHTLLVQATDEAGNVGAVRVPLNQ